MKVRGDSPNKLEIEELKPLQVAHVGHGGTSENEYSSQLA